MKGSIVPNLKKSSTSPNNNSPKVFFYFTVCLSLLGFIAFFFTKAIAVVIAMNTPLVTLIPHMKWKK
jgi:hypothetical protein